MIQLDIVLAIAIFLSILLTIVFVLWIFYNFHGGKEKTSAASVDQVRQCPYCTYVFVSYEQGDVVMCPRCKSYIAEQAPCGEATRRPKDRRKHYVASIETK